MMYYFIDNIFSVGSRQVFRIPRTVNRQKVFFNTDILALSIKSYLSINSILLPLYKF